METSLCLPKERIMFGNSRIAMDEIIPTSKMSLKLSCIKACNNDVAKASELYEFLAKDIASLPDFDVVPPSTYEQIKGIAGEIFGWVDQNQDKIIGAYNFIRSVRGGAPVGAAGSVPAGVPPIPE